VPPPPDAAPLVFADPSPEATAERAAAGARPAGTVRRREDRFATARGTVLLRRDEPGGATVLALGEDGAPTAAPAPVAEPDALLAGLTAAHGPASVVASVVRTFEAEDGARVALHAVDGGAASVVLSGPGDLDAWRRVLALGDPAASADPGAPPPDEELLRAAAEVAERAYAPYSRFRVGAALRTADGRIVTGANVENGAYPQGQCAEASALGALVAAGAERIVAVAVVSPDQELCPPCGGCRQRLAEFGDADVPVHLGRPGGPGRTLALGTLLPLAFGLGAA
jgi:homotetrameric cytidine deaminase